MNRTMMWLEGEQAQYWRYQLRLRTEAVTRAKEAVREKKDLSRQELAELAGVSREYVRKLEAGLYDPTVGTLEKLAKALGVPLTKLLE